jgi:hypothetical protein
MPWASPTIVRHPVISRASHPLGLNTVRANIPKLNSAFILPCGRQSCIFDIWSISIASPTLFSQPKSSLTIPSNSITILPLTIAKVSTFSLASYKAQVYQPICNCSEDLQNLAAFSNAMSSLY